MQITQLTPGDEGLLASAVRASRAAPGANHDAFLRDPTTLALVAVEGGEVLGSAWGLRQRHIAGYTQVQLYGLHVIEGARRRRIGRALVSAFLEVVRREGHTKMWLFTDEGNAPARSLYESLGGGPSGHSHATYWWSLSSTRCVDDPLSERVS
jgi:ribosomal protein S18 acetylase RimI-like enzyme